MTYCMSDIHGQFVRFQKMLELIQFSEQDHLYVIGDVVDRGSQSVEILEQIMNTPNITMILGNHEYMCLITCRELEVRGGRDHWYRNGGEVTYRQLTKERTPEQMETLLQFMEQLPDFLEIEVDGCSYHLVHGLPGDTKYNRVWKRPTLTTPSPFPDKVVIIGHTPTNEMDLPFTMWHGPEDRIIDIDCGCGEDMVLGKLGCLRLEDRKEFYVGADA